MRQHHGFLARCVLLMVSAWSTAGCLSFSTFQTADTLKEGTASFFIGLGYEQYAVVRKSTNEDTRIVESGIEDIKVPMLEYGLRYGLKPDLDVGLRSALFGAYTADLKYRFYRSRD